MGGEEGSGLHRDHHQEAALIASVRRLRTSGTCLANTGVGIESKGNFAMKMVTGRSRDDRLAGSGRLLFVMATDHEYREHLRARIDPLITGVGPVEAAIGTTIRLEQLRAAGALPDLVVSLGSAGSRRCELGGVYQIRSVSWRDMDASPIGVPPGVTPFADHPAVIALPTPLADVPCATLSTGSDIVTGDRYAAIDADLVDMETFAVLRACQRFGVPMIGLRGVSDGPGELDDVHGWTQLLPLLDERLAAAVDRLLVTD